MLLQEIRFFPLQLMLSRNTVMVGEPVVGNQYFFLIGHSLIGRILVFNAADMGSIPVVLGTFLFNYNILFNLYYLLFR